MPNNLVGYRVWTFNSEKITTKDNSEIINRAHNITETNTKPLPTSYSDKFESNAVYFKFY